MLMYMTFMALVCLTSATRERYLDGPPFSCLQHATKTPYKVRCGRPSDVTIRRTVPVPSGCRASFVTAVYRHGSRQLGAKDLRRILALESRVAAARAYGGALSWLNEWKFDSHRALDDSKELVLAGKEELTALGKALAAEFPSLMGEFSTHRHHLQSSDTNRTIESAMAFVKGAFSPESWSLATSHIWKHPTDHDEIIRFFDSCPRYRDEVKENKGAFAQVRTFKKKELAPVAAWLSKQLRFEVTTKDALGVWAGCNLDAIEGKGDKRWCSLLRPADKEVLVHMKDMKHYYKLGYGHQLSYQVASPLLRRIISWLAEHVEENGESAQLTLRALFGHAETVVPLLCLLGLYQDPKLGQFEADAGPQLRAQKNFQTSLISPFGANIVFGLYQCPPDGPDKAAGRHSSYRVVVKHNEHQVHLPGCSHMFCPFWEMRALSERALKGIGDFESFCASQSTVLTLWAVGLALAREMTLYGVCLIASTSATWQLAVHKAAARELGDALKLA